jgi:hypothetical protein
MLVLAYNAKGSLLVPSSIVAALCETAVLIIAALCVTLTLIKGQYFVL